MDIEILFPDSKIARVPRHEFSYFDIAVKGNLVSAEYKIRVYYTRKFLLSHTYDSCLEIVI